MRRSLWYNELFRSFSNYRVDNKGFEKARLPLRSLCECFSIGGELEEWTKLKKDETMRYGIWKENGKKGRAIKKDENAFQLDAWKKCEAHVSFE